MNIKRYCQKYIGLVACGLSLFGVTSCQKEQVGSLSEQINEAQGEMESVGINFAATAEETVIPFNPTETLEGLKAFNYNLSENSGKSYPKVKLKLAQGNKVRVTCIMRNTQTGNSYVFNKEWTYEDSKSSLRFNGNVEFPSGMLNYSPNNWKIFCIAGGTYDSGANKVTFAKQSGATPLQQGNDVSLEAIYMSKATSTQDKGWMDVIYNPKERKFTLPSNITMSNESVVLLCSASSTLEVDSVVTNDDKPLTDAQRIRLTPAGHIKGIEISSSQLASSGEYTNLNALTIGARPQFTTSETANTAVRFSVPSANQEYVAPKGRSNYYVISVIPRPNVSSASTSVKPVFGGHTDFIGSGPTITQKLSSGSFYNVKSLVLSKEVTQILPIEALYTAESSDNTAKIYSYYDKDGGSRDPNVFYNPNHSIPTWGAAIVDPNQKSNKVVDQDGRRYELGNDKQWRAIVPGRSSSTRDRNNKPARLLNFGDKSRFYNETEEIAPFGKTGTYKGDFWNKETNISYAIRFKDGENNKYRSAYRYERYKNGNDTYLKITQRYLGPTRTGVTIDDVSNENWWDKTLEAGQRQAERRIKAWKYYTNVEGKDGESVIIMRILADNGSDAYVVPDRDEKARNGELVAKQKFFIMLLTKDETL